MNFVLRYALKKQARRVRLAAAMLAASMVIGLTGYARNSLAQSRPLSAAAPVQPDHSDRILVLKNGGVMRGRIRIVSTGYLVAAPNGYVVMPFDKVHFDADSVEDAWLRMRLETRDPTVATHLTLARWCMSQKLEKGAIRELREALELDPSNETARLMLRRVDDEMRRQAIAAENATGQPNAFVSVQTPRQPDDAHSLAGVTPETAQQFVSQIQPLLLNRCGNARCHGSTTAEREFKLEHIRSGGNQRRRIERNLGAVLKHVDLGSPKQSTVLQAGFGVHGGQTIFVGRAGAQQLDTIQEWVLRAATELFPTGSAARTQLAEKPQAASSDWDEFALDRIRPEKPTVLRLPEPDRFDLASPSLSSPSDTGSTFGISTDTVRSPEQTPKAARASTDPDSARQPATSASELSNFQKLLQETAPVNDAFSPDEFNRKYSR